MEREIFHRIAGKIVVTGYAPDGDSLRFIAHDAASFARLRRSDAIVLGIDRSVQLRLEGIDAPELHYEGAAQPLAIAARDALLGWLGFTRAGYSPASVGGATCVVSEPGAIDVAILAAAADLRGRPIAYLLRGGDARHVPATLRADAFDRALLKETANHAQLSNGAAYLLAYTSMPASHRALFRAVARRARDDRRGVWADDSTVRGFSLRTLASIGVHGALVFPKLFRRCVDYLRDRAQGFRGNLTDWLRARCHDCVDSRAARALPLHALVEQRGTQIRLHADTLNVAFVER